MSKNIAVKVGGVSRNFSNVPKIQIKEALTGNNIDWIPEDEANDYAVTETLRISQNGTYHPSSGKCGFSEVVANVSGGGGTLIEKNITQNGEYYAMDDNADGYSKVSVNVASETNIMTRAEWDALTYEEKVAAGLTIIRNIDGEFQGVWYNYAYNLPIDVVCEYYGNTDKTIDISPDYEHLILWGGNWNKRQGIAYGSARLKTLNDITWETSQEGNIASLIQTESLVNKQTVILNQMHYGNNPYAYYAATQDSLHCYGAVIGVKPKSSISILAEYYDGNSHSYTFLDDYDAVVVLGTKSINANCDSLNVLTGDFSTAKSGEEFAINSAQVPMAQIFANVKKDSVVTTVAMPDTVYVGAVIIGINYI